MTPQQEQQERLRVAAAAQARLAASLAAYPPQQPGGSQASSNRPHQEPPVPLYSQFPPDIYTDPRARVSFHCTLRIHLTSIEPSGSRSSANSSQSWSLGEFQPQTTVNTSDFPRWAVPTRPRLSKLQRLHKPDSMLLMRSTYHSRPGVRMEVIRTAQSPRPLPTLESIHCSDPGVAHRKRLGFSLAEVIWAGQPPSPLCRHQVARPSGRNRLRPGTKVRMEVLGFLTSPIRMAALPNTAGGRHSHRTALARIRMTRGVGEVDAGEQNGAGAGDWVVDGKRFLISAQSALGLGGYVPPSILVQADICRCCSLRTPVPHFTSFTSDPTCCSCFSDVCDFWCVKCSSCRLYLYICKFAVM